MIHPTNVLSLAPQAGGNGFSQVGFLHFFASFTPGSFGARLHRNSKAMDLAGFTQQFSE